MWVILRTTFAKLAAMARVVGRAVGTGEIANAGLAPEASAGEALFIGPTMFARFSKTLAIPGSWGVQAAGRAAEYNF
jgi:hypothetical protein